MNQYGQLSDQPSSTLEYKKVIKKATMD